MITTERLDLLMVAGQVDLDGLGQLPKRLDDVLAAEARLLVADPSRVPGCDGGLFDLWARTNQPLGYRGGWLQPVGLGRCWTRSPGRAAEVLLVSDLGRAAHGVR